MKPSNPFFALLSAFFSFLLFPPVLSASQTRVAATGGLGTLLEDETADLNLYLDGNPAGLLYLNTKDRLDLSGEWSSSDQEGPWGSERTTVLSSFPNALETIPSYGGVMVFPDPHWAFQASGGVLSRQGFSAPDLLADDQDLTRYLGILRGSYAAPFACLGMELAGIQTDKSYALGSYDPDDQVLAGSSAQGSTRLKLGVAATFPDRYTADQTRFRVGVLWGTSLGDPAETRTFRIEPLSPPAIGVTQVWATRGSVEWGGEATMEVPGILKMMLDVHEEDASMEMTQTSTAPVTLTTSGPAPPFRTGNLGVDWNFKWTVAGLETEDLKLGGGLSYFRDSTTDANSAPGPYEEFATRLGVGLDSPRDHLVGVQWTGIRTLSGLDRSQIAFGGEKWISSTWALRLGLTGEIDHSDGASYETLDTVLDMGAGLQEVFGRVDLRLRLGQTVNMSDSSDTIGLMEGQVSGTLFI